MVHGFTYSIKVDPSGNKWFIQGRGITVYNEKGIHNQWVNPAKTVSGRVFFDTNRDGKYNAHIEPGIAKEKILILPDSTILFSNVYGKYYLVPTSNTKEVTYAPSANFQLTSVPAAYTLGTTVSQGLDFGVWSPSIPQNIELVSSNSILRCNAPISIYIQAFNKGYKAESGVLAFHYDPRVSFMSAEPMPTAVGDNTLSWNFEDLSYLETFSVKVVLDSLTINNIGDTLYFSSTLQTGEGVDAYRAEYYHSEAVRCSYDPNDKISRPTGVFSDNLSLKKDALDFTIRFQNTGNDTAFVVVVRDTLSAFLDITTFEVLASSYPVQTHLSPKGVVTFVFKDIHLLWQQKDDLASQGFVTYRIRARSDLADGVTIKNRAHIYFDLNPGIATNITFNQLVETLPTVGTKTIDLQPPWHLGPNPTNGPVWVDLPEGATKLRFFDLLQQHTSHIEFPNRSGYLHDLRPGIYIVCPDGFAGICKKLVVIKN